MEQFCSCGGKTNVVDDEIVCSKCGTVIERVSINTPIAPSYQNYDEQKKKTPKKPPTEEEKRISYLVQKEKREEKKDHVKITSILHIEKFCQRLNLPKYVSDTASEIFDDYRKYILKGRNNDEFFTSCIFLASRHYNLSRTLAEFTRESGIPKNKLSKMINLIKKTSYEEKGVYQFEQKIPSPELFLSKFSNHFNLTVKMVHKVKEILARVEKSKDYEGKSPKILLGAAIFLAMNQREQKLDEIAREIGCSTTALKKRVDEMQKFF